MAQYADCEICVDCAMWHANGDASMIDDPQRFEAVTWERRQFYVGEAAGFSWQRCDACGSTLGGDRFEAQVEVWPFD